MSTCPFEFRDINLETHADICVQFKAEALEMSFGEPDQILLSKAGMTEYLQKLHRRIVDLPGGCVHLWDGNQIAGQIEVRREPDNPQTAYVSLYYLAPPWRGRGLGRWMDEYVTDLLGRQGIREARLTVMSSNTPARRFYLNQGWKDLGPRPSRTGAIYMFKKYAP